MKENRMKNFIVVFFIGILSGTLFCNLYMSKNIDNYQIIFLDYFDFSMLLTSSRKNLFTYILLKRIKQFIIFYFISFISVSFFAFEIIIFIISNFLGILLSVGTMRMGLEGILMTLCYFMPHYILYILGFCMILKRERQADFFKKQAIIDNIFFFMIITIIVCIGCLLETFVNPILLNINT